MKLEHTNLLKVHAVFKYQTFLCVIMDDGKVSLQKLLDGGNHLSEIV